MSGYAVFMGSLSTHRWRGGTLKYEKVNILSLVFQFLKEKKAHVLCSRKRWLATKCSPLISYFCLLLYVVGSLTSVFSIELQDTQVACQLCSPHLPSTPRCFPCHLIIISPVAVLHLPEVGYSNLSISEITYLLGPPARRPQVPKNSDAYHFGAHATFLRIWWKPWCTPQAPWKCTFMQNFLYSCWGSQGTWRTHHLFLEPRLNTLPCKSGLTAGKLSACWSHIGFAGPTQNLFTILEPVPRLWPLKGWFPRSALDVTPIVSPGLEAYT